jgi:hypothetical protein
MDREALIDAIRARERGGRGPLSLARSLLGRVVHTVRSALPGTERRSDRPPPPASVSAPSAGATARTESPVLPPDAARALADGALSGVRVVDDGALAIVWRVSLEHVARAQAIAPSDAEMHLVTVRVSWPEGASGPIVAREDHGAVRSEGAFALTPRAPGERIVAAVGLASPDGRFVAIDHATAL